MTEVEARLVIEVLKEADSGCEVCVGSLLDSFLERFPMWRELTYSGISEGMRKRLEKLREET